MIRAAFVDFTPIGGIIGKMNFAPIGGKFRSLAFAVGYRISDSWRKNPTL
jgi:hypothetical protein